MTSASDDLNSLRQAINNDPFASSLGIRVEGLEPGYCRTSLTISPEMLNGQGVPHGGVIFTLADHALAGAANSHGGSALTLSVTINYVASVAVGTQLFAEAQQEHLGRNTGLYDMTVTDGKGRLVASCQATAYRKDDSLAAPDTSDD